VPAAYAEPCLLFEAILIGSSPWRVQSLFPHGMHTVRISEVRRLTRCSTASSRGSSRRAHKRNVPCVVNVSEILYHKTCIPVTDINMQPSSQRVKKPPPLVPKNLSKLQTAARYSLEKLLICDDTSKGRKFCKPLRSS
jgi:hypothetical protein